MPARVSTPKIPAQSGDLTIDDLRRAGNNPPSIYGDQQANAGVDLQRQNFLSKQNEENPLGKGDLPSGIIPEESTKKTPPEPTTADANGLRDVSISRKPIQLKEYKQKINEMARPIMAIKNRKEIKRLEKEKSEAKRNLKNEKSKVKKLKRKQTRKIIRMAAEACTGIGLIATFEEMFFFILNNTELREARQKQAKLEKEVEKIDFNAEELRRVFTYQQVQKEAELKAAMAAGAANEPINSNEEAA